MFLKQSTTANIKLGQFVDKTDGVTPETGLSPTVKLSKNGGTLAARNSATAIAHDADGYYTVELNATDTNTLGRLAVVVTDAATHLGERKDFLVLPANVFDSLVSGSDNLQVDAVQIEGGDASNAINAEMVDVLTVDTFAELASMPSATSSLKDKITMLFMMLRNKVTVDSTDQILFADDGSTEVASWTLTDSSGTFTKAEGS